MNNINKNIQEYLDIIKDQGLYKKERIITSQQSTEIKVNDQAVLNFCANNYLGLSNHPTLIEAAKKGVDEWGFGLSSVRFICGTQSIHTNLEKNISEYLGKEDCILYTSCFDANGGLFEALLDKDDVIISDELNHASIIDGIRLSKAQRYRYKNSDMEQLESILQSTQSAKVRMIATDGVFSMDGTIAELQTICNLADKYKALVMVDDSHATGFLGPEGKGSIDQCNVMNRVDIVTSTFGKALGGASGGFTCSSKEIISLLRQKSRPYLFSNSLAPAIVSTTIKVIAMLNKDKSLKTKLEQNTLYFRQSMKTIGFSISGKSHPIVPIMVGDAQLAQDMASDLLNEKIYVVGFSYPVVPKNKARIRVQISAAHTQENLDRAIQAFTFIGKKYKLI